MASVFLRCDIESDSDVVDAAEKLQTRRQVVHLRPESLLRYSGHLPHGTRLRRAGNAIQDRHQFRGKRGGIPPSGPSA